MTHFLENIIAKTNKALESTWLGRQKRFYFPLFVFGWKQKSIEIKKKMSLYKFTHMFLLKNEVQLKKKKKKRGKQQQKRQSSKFIIKKIMPRKKY